MVNVSAVVAVLGDTAAAAGAVGLAVLVMLAGVKVYRWVREAVDGGGAGWSDRSYEEWKDDPFGFDP